MVCSWNLHRVYFFKKMLTTDDISIDIHAFYKPVILSSNISRYIKLTKSLFLCQKDLLMKVDNTFISQNTFIYKYLVNNFCLIQKNWPILNV